MLNHPFLMGILPATTRIGLLGQGAAGRIPDTKAPIKDRPGLPRSLHPSSDPPEKAVTLKNRGLKVPSVTSTFRHRVNLGIVVETSGRRYERVSDCGNGLERLKPQA